MYYNRRVDDLTSECMCCLLRSLPTVPAADPVMASVFASSGVFVCVFFYCGWSLLCHGVCVSACARTCSCLCALARVCLCFCACARVHRCLVRGAAPARGDSACAACQELAQNPPHRYPHRQRSRLKSAGAGCCTGEVLSGGREDGSRQHTRTHTRTRTYNTTRGR